jgi:hypothetical protein
VTREERKLNATKASWKMEADRLVCRWSEAGERVQYNPPWMQNASIDVYRKSVSPSDMDFRKLSPFGGGKWYVPDPHR